MSTRHLDPTSFPLHGSRLIEASAGTGKTYTLAALYVRLVLNHGGENAFQPESASGEQLLPPDILVVTFTEAATRELRDRIRDRLAGAARCFRNNEAPDPGDDFLSRLFEEYSEEERQGCADRLEAAAQWMDEAAVYTIHGFSNRMLSQHAFDSGSLFHLELSQEEDLLLEEAVRDYWRTFFYSLDEESAQALSGYYDTPSRLLSAVRPLLDKTDALPAREGEGKKDKAEAGGDTIVRAFTAQREKKLAALKKQWATWVVEILEAFEKAWADGNLPKNKPSTASKVREWLGHIEEWTQDEQAVSPKLTDTAVQRLSPDEVREHGQDVEQLASHQGLKQIAELKGVEATLPDLPPALLPHAARWIARRLERGKRERGILGFQDMLTRLRDALCGDGGERLASAIRQQFPVALIDEFQDTDPIQYETFRRIYGEHPDCGWFMIGDPKQAIYGFRGADIYTYLQAKRFTQDRHYTLDTNRRSVPALVQAVNRVFDQANGNKGGAFLLGEEIPFRPVGYVDKGEALRVGQETLSGLDLWHLVSEDPEDPSLSKTEYIDAMAERTATDIVGLLNEAEQGRAVIERDDEQTPLRPRDIAILVTNWIEAGAVRRELNHRGVRSVYLSDRDNVFASTEARDMLRWLRACAKPESESGLRAALATQTLALSWQELDKLASSENEWEEQVEAFRQYRERWQRKGVLPMLRRFMEDFQVPARLLAEENERSLTNLLHLAELLQTAATGLDGEQALVRWLAEEIDSGGSAESSEEQILRLESDADLVKVVTIHKSKGLEYPVVYLPFVCSFRQVKAEHLPVRYHDSDGEQKLSLEPTNEILRQADRERLAEDLRLLYVAMTRARNLCRVGVAPMRFGRGKHRTDLDKSAIGHLLAGGEEIGPSQLPELLKSMAGGEQGIRVTNAPEADDTVLEARDKKIEPGPAREYQGPRPERWWIASYSALRPEGTDEEAPDSARDEVLAEEDRVTRTRLQPLAGEPDIHDFERGPMAGTFLHGLLEAAAEKGLRDSAQDDAWFRDLIERRSRVRGWEDSRDMLHTWLRDFLTTPLPLGDGDASLESPLSPGGRGTGRGGSSTPSNGENDHNEGVILADLTPAQYRPELEFWLPAHHASAAELDRHIQAHILPGQPRQALGEEELNGMLKGFVDLVFEHRGRYYVADYKSNRLGETDADYSHERMNRQVLEGRYDVQYSLYLLALHRLLRTRLGDAYDYDTHIGGCALLFLRGLYSETRGVHLARPARAFIEQLDALLGNKEVAHA